MTRPNSTPLALCRWTLPLLLAGALACSRDPISPPVAASGSGPRPQAPRLALAADDGLIAYTSHVWGNNLSLVNPDGSSPTVITNNFPDSPIDDNWPDLSPDGGTIVFQRGTWYPVVGVTTDIYVINADGTGLTNLTNSPDYQDTEAVWSPDGSKIAFKSNREASGRSNIYVMDSDGSNLTQVTFLTAGHAAREPTWSPDGTQIAFTTDGLEAAWILCVATIGGGPPSCATDLANRFGDQIGVPGGVVSGFFQPEWGPDGRIAVTVHWGECSGCHHNDVFLINSDFSGLTQLTCCNSLYNFFFPTWSPDGSKIAYQMDTGSGTTGMGVMNADGTGQTLIQTGWFTEPSWGGGVLSPPPPPAQCSDGEDNDHDDKVDYPDDPGCTGPEDDSESPDPPAPTQGTCQRRMDDLYTRILNYPGLRSRPVLLQALRIFFQLRILPAPESELAQILTTPAWRGLMLAVQTALGPRDRLVQQMNAVGRSCGAS